MIKPKGLCSSSVHKKCKNCYKHYTCLLYFELLGKLLVAEHKVIYRMCLKSIMQKLNNMKGNWRKITEKNKYLLMQ